MPRFFFHCEDGHLEYDQTGTELADAAAARLEGMQLAGALLKDRPKALWEGSSWRLLVTDEQHAVIFTVVVNTIVGSGDQGWKYMPLPQKSISA